MHRIEQILGRTLMGNRLFGTDGVRGLANRELTAHMALQLGSAAVRVLGEQGRLSAPRPRAIVGRDPRVSGHFLSAAVTAGLASAGVDVEDLGVLPKIGRASCRERAE